MIKEPRDPNLGTAVIRPDAPVIANSAHAWAIEYTIGATSIVPGGAVRFTIPYGFTPPQLTYPTGMGYTTLQVSNPAVRMALHLKDAKTGWCESMWGLHVYAEVESGTLKQGDRLTLNYGQGDGKGYTGDGAFVRYFEGDAEFTVLVDAKGTRGEPDGGFRQIGGDPPVLQILGERVDHLFAVVPSIAAPGKPLTLKLTARDRNKNTDVRCTERFIVKSPDGNEHDHKMSLADAGRCVFTSLRSDHDGVIRVPVRSADGTLQAISNPCLHSDSPTGANIYWGDLHIMTVVATDSWRRRITVISAGLGRPAEVCRYARDIAHMDFCAITDGDYAPTEPYYSYYSDEEWEENKQAVRDLYEPGRFVTILGSEYHERQHCGDKNILYREDDAALLRWCDLDGDQPEALWKALKGKKALTVPHHTASGSCKLNVWDSYDPNYLRLVEIYSIWGNSEAPDVPRVNFWENNFNNSIRSGLNKGYRFGLVASGDSHDGRPGTSDWMRLRRGFPNGLVAVHAKELTRETIFDALWDRHCYGTTGARIILFFGLNGAHMGDELSGAEHKRRRVLQVRAIGTGPIAAVDVVRNGREVHTLRPASDEVEFEWEDRDDFDRVCLTGYDGKPFVYYYVRVTQADGEIAWSSPIWIS